PISILEVESKKATVITVSFLLKSTPLNHKITVRSSTYRLNSNSRSSRRITVRYQILTHSNYSALISCRWIRNGIGNHTWISITKKHETIRTYIQRCIDGSVEIKGKILWEGNIHVILIINTRSGCNHLNTCSTNY